MNTQTNEQTFEAQKEQMKQIVERIDSWNGNGSSEGP